MNRFRANASVFILLSITERLVQVVIQYEESINNKMKLKNNKINNLGENPYDSAAFRKQPKIRSLLLLVSY